jgi:competence protein ComEA
MPERSASTIAIWAVAAVLAVLAGMRLLGGEEAPPAPVRVDGPAGGGAASAGAARSSAARAGTLYVHVAGAVRSPGLFRLPQGARTASAIERAGGPTRRADLTLVNLAAELQDGQQIVVPVRGAAASSSVSPGAPEAPIHLSSATVEQLDEIDGIGPTLAERIVEYRDTNGGLGSLEELAEVEGIGEKRLETLRDALQP